METIDPPIKNKAIIAILKSIYTYYTSKLGILTNITICLVKVICLFSVLFVTSHDSVTSNIKIFLLIYLVLNSLALFLNLVRFLCSYRSTNDFYGQESFKYAEYDALLGMLITFLVLTLTIVLKEGSATLEESPLLYTTLVYMVIFDYFLIMCAGIFILLFVVIASSLKRRKTSFILKLDESNKNKYQCCAICLESYEDSEFLMILYCKHNFHYECVSIWLDINNSCPICKKDLDLSISLYEDKAIHL